jgi:hypothetical protein
MKELTGRHAVTIAARSGRRLTDGDDFVFLGAAFKGLGLALDAIPSAT